MNGTETARTKAKVHTIYKNDAGEKLPSVTTILSILNKPALIPWAHKLGKAGIELNAYVDHLADIGKLAHRMILDHLQGRDTDTESYSPEQVDLAENCFLKYLEWERQHTIEPLICEEPLVSFIHQYGGTPDFYGRVDGVHALLDFKTGKGIYEDYWYQLGGYDLLLTERLAPSAWPIKFRILNIGRDETEQFIEEQRSSVAIEEQVFLHALAIYKLKHKK